MSQEVKRVCLAESCGTVLNQYNQGRYCYKHSYLESEPTESARVCLAVNETGEVEEACFDWFEDREGIQDFNKVLEIQIKKSDLEKLQAAADILHEKKEKADDYDDVPDSSLFSVTIPNIIIRALQENGFLKLKK